jgi:RimK family alpha-L-glutamate ligase
MQVVVLSKPGWHADELCRALAERGHSSRVLPYEGLVGRLRASAKASADESASQADATLSCDQTAILDADAVLARFIPGGSLEQIIYRLDALHWIEEHGVPVINPPRAIERSVDKFYTDARLREAGLPTPDTLVCERIDDAMPSIRAMLERTPSDGGERAIVIKPLFGSMGHGIVRVTDPDVAFRVLQSLDQIRAVFYIQRAVDSGGRDVRVFVVGGRVVGAIERRADGGDWRTNVSRGGSASPFDLPAAWAALALRAVAAIGADYAGVDLLPSKDGRVFVLEVNGIPGWQGLQRATGIDVAGTVVDHLLDRVRTPRTEAALPA